jgi:hypothetical protein
VGGEGEETATAAVGNVMRTVAAWSPAWTRGGKRRGVCDARGAVGRGERVGGGGEKRARAWRPAPFVAEAGQAEEGRGGGRGRGATRRVEGKTEEGSRGSVTWTSTARTRRLQAAPTMVDGTQGRAAACVTWNGAADRWGWATSGPDGSGQSAGERASERGNVAQGADRWARQHSAAQFSFKPNQKYFKRIQNSLNFD